MKDVKRGLSPQEDPLTPHSIRQSVHTVLFSDRAKSRGAERALLKNLNQDFSYEPVFHVIEAVLDLYTTPEYSDRLARKPQGFEHAKTFLATAIHATSSAVAHLGPRYLPLNQQTEGLIKRIARKHNQLMSDFHPFTPSFLPTNYLRIIPAIPSILEAAKAGDKEFIMEFALPIQPGEDPEQRALLLKQHEEWIKEVITSLEGQKETPYTPQRYDAPIQILKNEPLAPMRDTPIYYERFAGISLEDIENFPIPAWGEHALQITQYLTALLSNNPSLLRKEIVTYLFCGSIPYGSPSGSIVYEQKALLNRISNWQQVFLTSLYHEQPPEIDAMTKKFLELLPEKALFNLLATSFMWTVYQREVDPAFYDNPDQMWSPLADEALKEFEIPERAEEIEFVYGDELTSSFYINTILPRFAQRFEQLGLTDTFQRVSPMILDLVQKHSFDEIHKEAVKDSFERNCGSTFLENLNQRQQEVTEVTKRVWKFLTTHGFDFLPMFAGVTTLEFPKDTVPYILGIDSLSIKSLGTPQDWRFNVRFEIHNPNDGHTITTIGHVDRDGILTLRAPIDQHIPGLFTMLHHITILTIHDLAIQAEAIASTTQRTKKKAKAPQTVPSSNHHPDTPKKRYGTLPRRQSSAHLVESVNKETIGYTPRRVEVHPHALPFTKDYLAACQQYQEALEKGDEDERLNQLREIIATTREKAFKPSKKKLQTVPARFSLKEVIDPLTKEPRVVETWVVEYTSPKPTEEELSSLPTLEKYYKGSSALASLEQMKPWFIAS